MAKQIKLKDILKEHSFSMVGGVVSTPAINAGYGSLTQIVKEKYGDVENEPKVSSEQILSKIQEFGKLGNTIYQSGDLKETAKTLSDIASAASVHTLRETEDWFDKVTVNRNMKELTNLSKQFGKLSEEASSVQQRLSALYEDMGGVLGRYYDLNETHIDGHESDDDETMGVETGKENPYREPVSEADNKYAEFFRKAMNKFGVSSPAELGDKKKDFYDYVDKNYQAKQETD